MLSFDFLIVCSVFLFLGALLVIQAGYAVKESMEIERKDVILRDANTLGEIFFREGYPRDWNAANVQILGLESSGRISDEKLEKFGQLDVGRTMILMGLESEYNITVLCGDEVVRSYGAAYDGASSIVKKERVVVLENGTIATVRVLVFER